MGDGRSHVRASVKKIRAPGFSKEFFDHQLQKAKHFDSPLLQISRPDKLSVKIEVDHLHDHSKACLI
jgi:hypothetical protein